MFEVIAATSPGLIAALSAEKMPTSDLAEANRKFWRAVIDGETVGYVGLEIYDTAALLRSLVILPDHRDHGYGKQLVDHAIHTTRAEEVTDLWLLTKTAQPFFERLGWQVRERSDAPTHIAKSQEFESLCPASATCMSYLLAPASKSLIESGASAPDR